MQKNDRLHLYFTRLTIMLLVALILSVSLLSLVPPFSRDALTHHLAIPKMWIQDGAIGEYPHIAFSYYPMNLELLYALSLYLGSDIAPKFIHFAFALLTAFLIFRYVQRRLNRLYGLFGALFFLSLPVIVKLSITVYVDLGLVFFSFASILFFLKWIEFDFQKKHLVMSSIFCGLALGTKYNGLILLFLLSFFVPLYYSKTSTDCSSSQKIRNIHLKAIAYGILFASISLAVFSPWMIKNSIQTGNPIYPLGNKIFHTKKKNYNHLPQVNFQNIRGDDTELNHFVARKLVFKEKWWETALIPVRIFFQGRDNFPQYFDGKLTPFLLFLPLFAFTHYRKKKKKIQIEQSILAFFSILFLMCVFLQRDMRIRYILPIIPPLVILSAYGLKEIEQIISGHFLKGEKYSNAVIAVISVITIFINSIYIVELFHKVDPFPYITGDVTRNEYIQKKRPEYAVYKYINENLAGNSTILGVFIGNRRYYCDRMLIFDFKMIEKSVIYLKTYNEIALHLHQNGITHLMMNSDIFNKWANDHFKEQKRKLLKELIEKKMTLLFSKGPYTLYMLEE